MMVEFQDGMCGKLLMVHKALLCTYQQMFYDIDKMDGDYEGKKWTEEFTDMTESELMDWAKKNGENRKIVFETQVVNVAEVLQEGVTDYPNIPVMNLMKVKHDQ